MKLSNLRFAVFSASEMVNYYGRTHFNKVKKE